MDNVHTVLQAAERAISYEAQASSVESIDALASCTGPDGRFSTRVYSARDGRMTMMQGAENGRHLLAGIDDVDSWVYRPEEQQFTSLQPVSLTFLRGHELHLLALDPRSRFGEPEWLGASTFDEQAAVTLRFRDQLDGPLDIHYAREGGLPLGLTQVNHTGRGAETVTVVFQDWERHENELLLFSGASFRQGDDLYVYDFVRISINDTPNALLHSPERHPAGVDVALLRHLHDQQQTAHLTHDAGLFTSVFHDPISQASRGEVSRASRAESRQRSQAYFDQVEFVAWEDVAPPVIRVSQDGTMASNMVHKRIHLAAEGADGQRQEQETTFAWLESWEKVAGEWRLMMIASTNN